MSFPHRREAHRQGLLSGGGGAGPSTSAGGARAADVFGLDVDEMWNDPVAQKIGLTAFGRRRTRRTRRKGKGKKVSRRFFSRNVNLNCTSRPLSDQSSLSSACCRLVVTRALTRLPPF